MTSGLMAPPLARWDGLHLVLDLPVVERHLNAVLARGPRIRDLELRGAGDAIGAELTATWKGMPARVALELAEIRLRHRHLGFRMRRIRALGGVPVPRLAVTLGLRALDSDLLRVLPGDGIVVVDLRRWLPAELDLCIVTVQATSRSLHVWFGPGRLEELPRRARPRLRAGGGDPV